MMTLEVTRCVLALPVRLIIGLTINDRASVPSTNEMCVDVIDMYHEPAVQLAQPSWRRKVTGDLVQPDARLTEPHLAMYHSAVGARSMPSEVKPKNPHPIVKRGFDVFVDEDWDNFERYRRMSLKDVSLLEDRAFFERMLDVTPTDLPDKEPIP